MSKSKHPVPAADTRRMPSPHKEFAAPDYDSLTHALGGLYMKEVAPVEAALRFGSVGTFPYTAAEFGAKPIVFLLGPYSVGKTTFIRTLLGGKDFPAMAIGPEPTTDAFMAIEAGASDRNVPGSAATADTSRPWGALAGFGSAFAAKFSRTSVVDAPILDDLIFVDSPGVLSGEKQSAAGRKYDFVEVAKHFAERADLILVLVDAHKLDLSDEFTGVLRAIQSHDEKMRVVLNKADAVTTQELLRVTTAMAWSLSRCLRTPEVKRVYVSSFRDGPFKNEQLASFFEEERDALVADLKALKAGSVQRRTNEVLRRIAALRAHGAVVEGVRRAAPLLNRERWARSLDAAALEPIFQAVAREREIPRYALPSVDAYASAIASGKLDPLHLPSPKAALATLAAAAEVKVPHAQRYFRRDLEDLPEDEPSPVRSFLHKLDGKHKYKLTNSSYKKRWCVLDSGVLRYFHARADVDAAAAKPAGELALRACAVRALPDSDRSFAFQIEGPSLDRVYVLAADTAEDMATWIRQIRAHASGRTQRPGAAPLAVSEPPPVVIAEPVVAVLVPDEPPYEADAGPHSEVRMSLDGSEEIDGLIVGSPPRRTSHEWY